MTDDRLHAEGVELLARYRAVVTGTHPEYTSTRMLDALEQYLERGGRLIYAGGNGFYWRIGWSDAWPGAIEVRRAEDGTRAWESQPGEAYHAWGGELGGLWRRLGRAPRSSSTASKAKRSARTAASAVRRARSSTAPTRGSERRRTRSCSRAPSPSAPRC